MFDCSDVQTFRRSFIHTHGIKRLHDGSRISPDHAGYGPEGLQGNGGRRAVPFAEGAGRGSLPAQGCRGLKALGRGSGKGHPGGGVQRERHSPCGVVGAKPPALIGLNIASQRSGCGGVDNILPY